MLFNRFDMLTQGLLSVFMVLSIFLGIVVYFYLTFKRENEIEIKYIQRIKHMKDNLKYGRLLDK